MSTCKNCGAKLVKYQSFHSRTVEWVCDANCKITQPFFLAANDPPTEIIMYEDGITIHLKYWKNESGELHRGGDKPASIGYNRNGTLYYEAYYIHDEHHRVYDKPTSIVYYDNGVIKYEVYMKNDKMHRTGDKPAYIKYHEDGTIDYEQYWLNDVEYTKSGKFIRCTPKYNSSKATGQDGITKLSS